MYSFNIFYANQFVALLLGIDQFIFEIKAKEERALQKKLNEVAKEYNTEEGVEEVVQEETPLVQEQEEIFLSENALSCIIKCIDLFSKPMIHPHILFDILMKQYSNRFIGALCYNFFSLSLKVTEDLLWLRAMT